MRFGYRFVRHGYFQSIGTAQEIAKSIILNALRRDFVLWPIDMPQLR
jgi:hypothetical protein